MFGFILHYPYKAPFYSSYIRQLGQQIHCREAHTHTMLLSDWANVHFLLPGSCLRASIILYNEQVLCLTCWSTNNYSVRKGLPVLKSENTLPIYKVKISQVSRNNNILCILFTYFNFCSSGKFYLKSEGKKKSCAIICIHSENFMIWEDILHGQNPLHLLTYNVHKEIKIYLMVVPELKQKGKRIKANLGYWENVSQKQHTQTQEQGSEGQCIFSYIPTHPQ